MQVSVKVTCVCAYIPLIVYIPLTGYIPLTVYIPLEGYIPFHCVHYCACNDDTYYTAS